MFARNRFSALAPDEPLSPHPPPFEGHRVVEFKDRPVTPAEGRAPLPVNVTVPSSAQNEEQGSIHELEDLTAYIREQAQHEAIESVGADTELLNEAPQIGSSHIQIDNVDTSRLASGEPIAEAVIPPVERAEIIPEIWRSGHPYVFRPPVEPVNGDVWEKIRAAMEKNDHVMCKAWNGELDTILVFTGLFSAAVTAFCIESFQSLSQNPADTTNALLFALSLQLANSSSPAADTSIVNAFTPAKHDVQINVLYFVSLAFALSVSSVCIMGKQWIREYEKDVVGTPCDAVRVRQMRYDSLEAWKVPQIIAALPVVLIVALLLFFSGLLVQLWHVSEHTTAIAVTAVVAFTALLVIVTTFSPVYCESWHSRASFVPFRSPQARLCSVVYWQTQYWLNRVFKACPVSKSPPISHNWNAFDLHFLKVEKEYWFQHDISSIHRALRWVYHTLSTSGTVTQSVLWCLQSPKALPIELMNDDNQLSSYVLAEEEPTGLSYWPDRAWYDFSGHNFGGWKNIESPLGRYQAEMLIRVCNQAIDCLSDDWSKAMDQINDCCDRLYYYHHVFDSVSPENAPHQHDIQDQISLMLKQLFAAMKYFPSGSQSPPDFDYIFRLLSRASSDSKTALSLRVARIVVIQGISAVLWKRKSMSLALTLAREAVGWYWDHFDLSEKPFVKLDKVMLEIWSKSEDVEGLTETNLYKWEAFRLFSITRDFDSVDLAALNGPLPTWNASAARTGPSKLDRFFSVFGIGVD